MHLNYIMITMANKLFLMLKKDMQCLEMTILDIKKPFKNFKYKINESNVKFRNIILGTDGVKT